MCTCTSRLHINQWGRSLNELSIRFSIDLPLDIRVADIQMYIIQIWAQGYELKNARLYLGLLVSINNPTLYLLPAAHLQHASSTWHPPTRETDCTSLGFRRKQLGMRGVLCCRLIQHLHATSRRHWEGIALVFNIIWPTGHYSSLVYEQINRSIPGDYSNRISLSYI